MCMALCTCGKPPLFCVPSALLTVIPSTKSPEGVRHVLVLQIEKLRQHWGTAGLSMS